MVVAWLRKTPDRLLRLVLNKPCQVKNDTDVERIREEYNEDTDRKNGYDNDEEEKPQVGKMDGHKLAMDNINAEVGICKNTSTQFGHSDEQGILTDFHSDNMTPDVSVEEILKLEVEVDTALKMCEDQIKLEDSDSGKLYPSRTNSFFLSNRF